MRKIRECNVNTLATGKSACQIEMGKIIAVLLVEHGNVFDFTEPGSVLRACHGAVVDKPYRAYPITDIVEYARNGGEPQTGSVGYGGVGVTGVSGRTDVFTVHPYSEHLAASISKNMNRKFDAYYIDENNYIFGIDHGDGKLRGFPMNSIFCTATPHPTSSAQASMTISLCFTNARKSIELFDYYRIGYSLTNQLVGLVPVDLVEVEKGKYKIIESKGGYDRTAEFGLKIAQVDMFTGVTAVTYSNQGGNGLLTITTSEGSTPKLKNPAFLFGLNVQGIEYNKTVKLATT